MSAAMVTSRIETVLRLIARHLGTVIPAAVTIAFVYAATQAAQDSFTWERPALYLVAILSTIGGLVALVQLARRTNGNYPSVLMVTFVYEKVTIALTFLATLLAVSNALFPSIPNAPSYVILGLLAGTAVALLFNNGILLLGYFFNIFNEPCDPIPFRQLVRAIGERLRGGRK